MSFQTIGSFPSFFYYYCSWETQQPSFYWKNVVFWQMLGRDAAVPLSNSLSLADRRRIAYLNKHQADDLPTDNCAFRFGEGWLLNLIIIIILFIKRAFHYQYCLMVQYNKNVRFTNLICWLSREQLHSSCILEAFSKFNFMGHSLYLFWEIHGMVSCDMDSVRATLLP